MKTIMIIVLCFFTFSTVYSQTKRPLPQARVWDNSQVDPVKSVPDSTGRLLIKARKDIGKRWLQELKFRECKAINYNCDLKYLYELDILTFTNPQNPQLGRDHYHNNSCIEPIPGTENVNYAHIPLDTCVPLSEISGLAREHCLKESKNNIQALDVSLPNQIRAQMEAAGYRIDSIDIAACAAVSNLDVECDSYCE